jgi:hypothetical protein
VETTATMIAPCEPSVLYEHVELLDRYPAWMPLVHDARRVDDERGDLAWTVELRTRVGPLARSKRLRMVRVAAEPDRSAVFERREVDGRSHSPWVLRADVAPVDGGSRLTMHLSYGGSLWTGGVLQRILDDEIRRGSDALLRLVSDGPMR